MKKPSRAQPRGSKSVCRRGDPAGVAAGLPVGALAITVRHRGNESDAEAHRLLKLAVATARIVAWTWHRADNAITLAPHQTEIIGLPAITSIAQALDLVHPEDRPRHVQTVVAAVAEALPYHSVFRVVAPETGALLWLDEHATPVTDDQGQLTAFSGVIRDITEPRRDEIERGKLAQLIEHSSDLIAIAELDGGVRYMNAAGRRMIGLRADQDARTLNFADYVAPGWKEFLHHTVIPSVQEGGLWEGEMQLRNLDTGALIDVIRSTFLLRDPVTAAPVGIATVTRNITQRKRLERQLLDAGERERQQLGHDLHDGIGQQLHALHFLATLLQKELREDASPRAGDAARLSTLLRETIGMTRGLARGLQPVSPVPEGLVSALRELARRTCALFQIECRLVSRQPALVFDPMVATQLYRIAQEAVSNAVKHAKPTRISLTLRITGGRLFLGVKDNGMSWRRTRRPQQGLGVQIMHHRAHQIAGSLAIVRLPRGGTQVLCSVPGAVAVPQPVCA